MAGAVEAPARAVAGPPNNAPKETVAPPYLLLIPPLTPKFHTAAALPKTVVFNSRSQLPVGKLIVPLKPLQSPLGEKVPPPPPEPMGQPVENQGVQPRITQKNLKTRPSRRIAGAN